MEAETTPTGTDTDGSRPALAAVRRGEGPPVVLAHGFTQTGRLWGPMAEDLSVDHLVVAVDLPGHGDSRGVRADLVTGAELLGDAGGRGAYVGYSMGARYCLHLALARPDLVTCLVLVSGTAGIDDEAERTARRLADERLADELDPPAGGPDPLPLGAFLDRWLAQPLFAGLPPAAAGTGERLRNDPVGLAWSLRLAGTGTQRPLWSDVGGLAMPVVVVTGARDTKFSALGRRLAAAIGANARHAVVPDAGHAPHLERPGDVADLVRRAVERSAGRSHGSPAT
ncbi:MAG: alpha/beta fold hydrolase [Actinomycetota bacterium]|nr:alpha/beta fold hydrolase [Actinomycetota bacterium]